MNPQLLNRIRYIVQHVVTKLVQREYVYLEQLTLKNRLTHIEMATAVRDYGKTLTFPPSSAFENLDLVEVTSLERFSVRFPLYTKEEGKSDLTIEMTLADAIPVMRVEIDNILVL